VPFTDDELTRIISACDPVRVEWKNESGVGVWTGEDLKDLIWLMVYTELRISDATLFDMERLHGDQVFLTVDGRAPRARRMASSAARCSTE
jgi:integrase